MLEALLEVAPFAIVIADPRGRISRWSTAAERVFGWTGAEVDGQPLAAVVGVDAEVLLEQAREGGGITSRSIEGKRKDKATVHLNATCTVSRDEEGTPTRMVATFQDAPSSRAVERRFVDAQRLEVVDRIAGTIAHDLKNVLSAIKGFAIVAGEGLAGNEQARSDLEQILKASERGAALAQKLLAFSRNPVAQPSGVDLNQLLLAIDKTLRRLISPGLELVVRQAPDLGLVKADAAQIEQVIVNLVLNAQDAMPAGGRLTIETLSVDVKADEKAPPGQPPGRYARLVVADTGSGMPPETLARMFEPFFTTKGPERALGLGLSATRAIVRQMGGHIAAHSERGHGTTFTVDLPSGDQAPPREVPAAPRRVATGGAGSGETILVVEDDDLVRMLTVKVLRRRGYDVLEAPRGADAAQRAAAHRGPIHLLLSDVGLPNVTGPDLARQILSTRPEMKVLFMSGYGRSALAERGLAPGPSVLEKPFSPDALLERIRTVLEGARSWSPDG